MKLEQLLSRLILEDMRGVELEQIHLLVPKGTKDAIETKYRKQYGRKALSVVGRKGYYEMLKK